MFYILFCVCCLYAFLRLWFSEKLHSEPPMLSGGLPLIGHGLKFFGDSISNQKNIDKISEECSSRGGILRGYFGTRRAYCVTDPEAVLTISNTFLKKEYMYDFAKAFAGDGLITGDVPIWKKHRKLLNPAFSQPVLNNFIACFNSQARRLVDQLGSHLGTSVNHENKLKENNLELICLTATGTGNREFSSIQQKYLLLIPKVQLILCERFQKIWLHSTFIYNISKLKKEHDKLLKPFVHLSSSIIQKKKDQMNNNSDTNKSGRLKPFVELLINIANATNCLTDEQIRHETDTIIAAGHETAATVLNIVFVVLGSYLEIQEKVYNEILQVCGPSDRDLNKDDLCKLVYLEAVVKETLRLYPIVPVIARCIDKDIQINNYTLKKNSSCFIFLNGLNKHPVWGPDANQFRPERWLDMATLPDLNAYGSFAVGKRNCIGKMYAIMSMKTTLAHVIRRYQVSADISKLVLKWHMLTYPASGHNFALVERSTM